MLSTNEMPVAREDWKWFGRAGHLIISSQCLYHLCTQVGNWLVSTVGEYQPHHKFRDSASRFETIGWNRLYETMVFKAGPPCTNPECNCGTPIPSEYIEVEMKGYNDARSADAGHLAMCEKWAAITEESHAEH